MTERLTDTDILHDFYMKFHRAAELQTDDYWRDKLRNIAEQVRGAAKLAGEVAANARRATGVSKPEAYAACSAAQTAAIRVVDAIEDQDFTK